MQPAPEGAEPGKGGSWLGMTAQPAPPDGYRQPEQCKHPQRLDHKVRTRIGHQVVGGLAPDG
jgi:hypothetical protein